VLTNSVACTIERRLLVNYRIDPEVVQRQLPAPFRPQLVSGWAVGGVCFIRLGALRPNHSPSMVGIRTENVAHRFAVEWDDDAGTQVGVFIPRRDTNSRITAVAGDRLFPGMHRLARFEIHEGGGVFFRRVGRLDDSDRAFDVPAPHGPNTPSLVGLARRLTPGGCRHNTYRATDQSVQAERSRQEVPELWTPPGCLDDEPCLLGRIFSKQTTPWMLPRSRR
jgi:hypothetical protein